MIFHLRIRHQQSHIYQKLTLRLSDPSCHHRNHHPRSQMTSPQAPPKMPEIPRMLTTYEKAPSADVDKILRSMNKMPSSSKNKEKMPLRRDIDLMDLFSHEAEICPEQYVHGRPFLPRVDLQLNPWELKKVPWLDHDSDEARDQGNHNDGPTFYFRQPNRASNSH